MIVDGWVGPGAGQPFGRVYGDLGLCTWTLPAFIGPLVPGSFSSGCATPPVNGFPTSDFALFYNKTPQGGPTTDLFPLSVGCQEYLKY